jgi:hypothetical protein
VSKNVFKEEAVFVDLSREETKQLLSRDDVIREWGLANINLIVI